MKTPTFSQREHGRLLVANTLLLAALAGACSGGNTGTDGRLSPVDMVVRGCDDCANGEARLACLEQECADVFTQCFGRGYRSGDYTGALCESGLECLAASPLACDEACAATPTCLNCVANDLEACGQSNDCPNLECAD